MQLRKHLHLYYHCRSQGDFLSFLDTVKVDGGDDECEDVIGGLEVALDENKLHWQSNEHATKVCNGIVND